MKKMQNRLRATGVVAIFLSFMIIYFTTEIAAIRIRRMGNRLREERTKSASDDFMLNTDISGSAGAPQP
jgi:succinate dehydrogenase hydrophobic anchor subunit